MEKIIFLNRSPPTSIIIKIYGHMFVLYESLPPDINLHYKIFLCASFAFHFRSVFSHLAADCVWKFHISVNIYSRKISERNCYELLSPRRGKRSWKRRAEGISRIVMSRREVISFFIYIFTLKVHNFKDKHSDDCHTTCRLLFRVYFRDEIYVFYYFKIHCCQLSLSEFCGQRREKGNFRVSVWG